MPSMTIEYHKIEGTGACVGKAGAHSVVADRPEGKASGTGLGFNGGELLALAIGGCFCNDVHYTADEMGTTVASLRVAVSLTFNGDPLIATGATVTAECTLDDGGSVAALLERARRRSAVANSLQRGVPVTFAS